MFENAVELRKIGNANGTDSIYKFVVVSIRRCTLYKNTSAQARTCRTPASTGRPANLFTEMSTFLMSPCLSLFVVTGHRGPSETAAFSQTETEHE